MENKSENLSGTTEPTQEQNQWSILSELPKFDEMQNSDEQASADLSQAEQIEQTSADAEAGANHIDVNRNLFNATTRRIAMIQQKFSDLDTAPQSIQKEYWQLIAMRGRLYNNNADTSVLGVGEADDGAIVSQWKMQEYNEDLGHIAKLHEANAEFFEPGAEEQIYLPEINLESFKERIGEIGSDYKKLESLNLSINQAKQLADYDTMEQLDQIAAEAKRSWSEEFNRAEKAEFEHLEASLAAAEDNLRQAKESHNKLNIFRKAWIQLRRLDDRDELALKVAEARNKLKTFQAETGYSDNTK